MVGMLDTTQLLEFYRSGVFPMANDKSSHWIEIVDPEERGILPLPEFHVPKRLRRRVRQQPFTIKVNTAFAQTMSECADTSTADRDTTWINDGILNLYCALHKQGYAHSIECWEDSNLVGGLYGVSLNGAFFGESMFSRRTDASKIALVHLAAGLKAMNFTLLDAQFHNPHLEQFGMVTLSRASFHTTLRRALQNQTQFTDGTIPRSGPAALQAITQTS